MGGVILGLGLMVVLVAICATLLSVIDGPDQAERRNLRAAACHHVLRDIIRDNLYCATCNGRVTVQNCTGWDEDGNVWDDCQGKVPLIDDITWKPTLQNKDTTNE